MHIEIIIPYNITRIITNTSKLSTIFHFTNVFVGITMIDYTIFYTTKFYELHVTILIYL